MVEFITGAAGSGKSTLMFERIKQESENADRVCIIVPEQYSYEFDKTLYFYLGAERFNELMSLSFTSLARQLFQLFGEPDRKGEYADDLARMIIIYQAISAVRNDPASFSYFRRTSMQNGFAEEMLKLINDMKRSGIAPNQLAVKAVMLDNKLRDKTDDVASVYFEYERLMEEYGYKDELENVREAAKTANLNQYFKGRKVFIDEFESFTGDQIEMLKVMISSADDVVITLRTDDPDAGEFTLFETVNRTFRTVREICRQENVPVKVTSCEGCYRFAKPDLEYLSRHIMRNFRYEPQNSPSPDNISIFEARDMYSEAEYVCAEIKRMIYADSSLRFRDIAIISNDIAQYSEVLKAAFRRYDIPYFLSIEKPVDHTSVMVFFTALLDLMSSGRFRTEQMFRLIKCGILDISVTDSSLLENYCYKWSVDGDMWTHPFTAEDEGVEELEELRKNVVKPLVQLRRKLSGENTAQEVCGLLYGYLTDCGADKSLGRLMVRLIRQDRDYEAAELKRLWGCLMEILDSVASAIGDKVIPFPELSRIIRSMIGRLTYSVPPQTLDGVIAASARTARLNAPKVLFVMGVNEGSFPQNVDLHGLFSEADKQKLANEGIEIARPVSDLIAAERLIVYKSLSAASHRLYVTYPLSDLSGQVRYPAQAVDSIIRMFGRPDIRITEDMLTPDRYAVTLHSAYYHYMQDRKLNTRETASIRKVLTEVPEYSRRISQALSRSGFSHDYKIDRNIMEKLKNFEPLRVSPSGLENYNRCHFMYFCDSCLKLQKCEKVELDSRIAGDLTHNCLRSVLASRTKDEFVGLSYDQLCGEIRRAADSYREEKLGGDFGKTPKFGLIFNKLTERLADVFLYTQQSLMASSFVPDAFELDLRDKRPAEMSFGDGKKLVFGGIVDRMDVCTIGDSRYLRIIDYKSSRKNITSKTLAGGLNMQMLIYLFSATEANGLYSDCKPAGVLYSPVQINSVTAEESKTDTLNSSVIESGLKGSGLVLSDMDVLSAMESGVNGRFIPVKTNKDGAIDSRSSCISPSGMELLREYTYGKLKDMAESLLSGDAEALPLVMGTDIPCTSCDFGDICGNSEAEIFRSLEESEVEKADEILSMKTERGEG